MVPRWGSQDRLKQHTILVDGNNVDLGDIDLIDGLSAMHYLHGFILMDLIGKQLQQSGNIRTKMCGRLE